jgi:hypothetical protein
MTMQSNAARPGAPRRRLLAAVSATAICAAALGGCTTYLSSSTLPNDGTIRSGYAYKLPRVVYDIEITRVLTACPSGPHGAMAFDAVAAASASTIGGEEFTVRYDRLDDGAKTTDLALESYPSGILKSVNIEVDDHTAAIAKQVVNAGVSIAKMVIGVPTGAPGGVEQQQQQQSAEHLNGHAAPVQPPAPPTLWLACTPMAEQQIKQLPLLKDIQKQTASEATAAAKAVDAFVQTHPSVPDSDTALRQQQSKLLQVKLDKDALAKDAAETLGKAISSLTLHARFKKDATGWPPFASHLADARDGEVAPESLFEVRALYAGKQYGIALARGMTLPGAPNICLEDSSVHEGCTPPANPQPIKDALGGFSPDMPRAAVLVAAKAESGALLADAGSGGASVCDKGKGTCGIVYRSPAPAKLQICSAAQMPVADPNRCWELLPDNPAVLFSDERNIPQAGPIVSLPLHNGPFENNTLTAEFAEDGTLTKLGYKKPNAQVEQAAGSLNDAINGAQTVLDYQAGAPLRQAQNNKALYDAQAAEKTSAAALVPSDVTKTDNETALIQSQTKKVQQQIELKKAQQELDAMSADASSKP